MKEQTKRLGREYSRNGFILHEDINVVVIATGFKRGSSNAKTGAMIQTWILRKDMDPIKAVKTGEDWMICGSCPLKATKQPNDEVCEMTITKQQFDDLQKLAVAARPLDDDDDGSERQEDAANAFWNACARTLGAPYGDDYDGSGLGEDFDNWCLKATTDEMLDEAITLLKAMVDRA